LAKIVPDDFRETLHGAGCGASLAPDLSGGSF
jgi:hypothetical protein